MLLDGQFAQLGPVILVDRLADDLRGGHQVLREVLLSLLEVGRPDMGATRVVNVQRKPYDLAAFELDGGFFDVADGRNLTPRQPRTAAA